MPELPVQVAMHIEEANVRTEEECGVSLVDELGGVADAIGSAGLLAELLATNSLPDKHAIADVPRFLASVLSIAEGRIRLLRKIVLGEAAPRHVSGRHNRRDPTVAKGDLDVVLLPRTSSGSSGRPRR